MRFSVRLLVLALFLGSSFPSYAHFQELIPAPDILTPETGGRVSLEIAFTHPMENGPAMEMGAPRRFGVLIRGEAVDLVSTLKARRVDGAAAYSAVHEVRWPGDHIYFLEPAPYWEPGEGKMIVHYTKVVVDAFGLGGGWDASVGFPVEIEPLVRPYGLWTGNLFRGVVRRNGKPVPFAEVEVEYRSEGRVTAPSAPYVTQVVKADTAGVFAYAIPRAGWWGFAALVDGEELLANPDGNPVPVELGGLIWVQARDMR